MLKSGTKKTLGSIDFWYSKYVENKSVKSSMKDFINYIKFIKSFMDDYSDLFSLNLDLD